MQFYCADCNYFFRSTQINVGVCRPAEYYVHWNYFINGSLAYFEKIKFYCEEHFKAYDVSIIDDFCLSYGFTKDLIDKRTSI